MSGSADGREAPEEGSATMRLDARFHSDVLGRLSRVADHLHALRDELVTVCAVADRAVGEGVQADAFRSGARPIATECVRGVDTASSALDTIVDRARRGAEQIVDTDRELAARGRADTDERTGTEAT
ncbi:hypothetical protein [Gordonia otitidis]|nr:hypothetical protein [Gordonia otitidis]